MVGTPKAYSIEVFGGGFESGAMTDDFPQPPGLDDWSTLCVCLKMNFARRTNFYHRSNLQLRVGHLLLVY